MASTTTVSADEAGFFWPVTLMVSVWLPSLSPVWENSNCWNCLPDEA